MQDSPKQYFMRRIGKPVPFIVEFSPPVRGVMRREFEITPRGMDGTYLLAGVTSRDFSVKNVATALTSTSLGQVRFQTAGIPTPGDIVEAICRSVSPQSFRGKPEQVIAGGDETVALIRQSIEALQKPGGIPEGDAAPAHESILRIMKFAEARPDIVAPAVFSSKDGTLRARWQHGADRTLFVAFPATGPLPLTLSIPRQGNYGMIKVNARCLDDDDIPQFAATVGIRITRS